MTKQMMVIVALFIVLWSVFIEPGLLKVTTYEIENKSLHGVRVAFLSDFHLKKSDYKRLDKIVRLTNSQSPDIVLLGGDYAKSNNVKNSMDPSITAIKLSLLSAPTYAVLGETDSLYRKELTEELKQNGIRVLENSSVRTMIRGRYLDIAGIMDISEKYSIERALKRTSLPIILLSHNPDIYYKVLDDVSLILAGHTHGGHFVIPFTPPLFVNSKFGVKFASGLILDTKNPMIISRGLGTSSLPFRFNCKPEIVIVNFVRTSTTHQKQTKK